MGEKLPMKAAYAVSKLARQVHKEQQGYQEARMNAIKRLASKDEKGELLIKDGQVEFEPENREAFLKELKDLGDVEIEISPIALDSLGDKVEITAETMLALGELIKVD
jgi:hypothetical protein